MSAFQVPSLPRPSPTPFRSRDLLVSRSSPSASRLLLPRRRRLALRPSPVPHTLACLAHSLPASDQDPPGPSPSQPRSFSPSRPRSLSLRSSSARRVSGGGRAAAMVAAALAISTTYPALAANNPDLLPKTPTPVIDVANVFPSGEERTLVEGINAYEAQTGWKLRIVTAYKDNTPGNAVKAFWGLPDPKSVVIIADPSSPNILTFSAGDDVYAKLGRTFWLEMQSRFGNQFAVKELGEDKAILGAVDAIQVCLKREAGCTAVPGLPWDQYQLTLATSIAGGIVAGFAARTGQSQSRPRALSWAWVGIFSPLWGILFGSFGLAPIITRTDDPKPVLANLAAFLLCAAAAFFNPLFVPGGARREQSEEL